MARHTGLARRKRRGLRRRLRDLFLTLRDWLFERTWLVSFGLVVGLGLLVWPGFGLRPPLYEVGQIAPRTVRAVTDFTYEDEATTEERRREAVELVPDVYEFDAQAREAVRQRIAQAFRFGRAALTADIIGEPDVPVTLADHLGIAISERQVQLLVEVGFSEEIEQSLADTVASVLARDILAEKGALVALGRPIQRRDPTIDASEAVEYPNVLSPEEAASAVELQILALSDLDGARRRTLAELGAALIHPTLALDEVETTRLRAEAEQSVDPVVIQVRRGRTIVRAGDEVTELARRQMEMMRSPSPGASWTAGLGAMLFGLAAVGLLQVLLHPARKGRRWRIHLFVMSGVIIGFHLALTRLLGFLGRAVAAQLPTEPFSDPGVYLWVVPFAAAPLLVVILENQASAVVTHTILSAALAIMTGNVTLGLFALLTGLGAIALFQRSGRRELVRVGAMVGLGAAGLVLSMGLIRGTHEGASRLALEGTNAFLGGLLAAPLVILLLPIFETVFERSSHFLLLDLSRRDTPILRRLALTASGTYQHSVLVGLLGESAAKAIGANSTLCVTGALYHDIGKMEQSGYFVENMRGEESPHDDLPPETSAAIIRRHVSDGIETAERLGLPRDVLDMIPQHHGTRIMTVFHEKARTRAAATGKPVDESLFRYAGPRPQTREAAIIMMADSIEAAARTLRDASPAEMQNLIDRITKAIVDDGQLVECDLTLADMDRIRGSFLETLTAIQHQRVPYPGFNFRRSASA